MLQVVESISPMPSPPVDPPPPTGLHLPTTASPRRYLASLEIDFAISEPGLGRFRVNVFHQRGFPAMVMRYITADMPKLETLGLPEVFRELIMLKRGLILLSCGTYANVIRVLVPLTASDALVNEGLDVLEAALLAAGALFEAMSGLARKVPIDPRSGTVPPA